MTTEEISLIKRYFDSKHVVLCPTWLHEGLKWCKENLDNSYTIEELKFKIFEQWILLDLRDVEVPVLPPGLASMKKHTLNGSYSLQMMKVVDISKPKYWQLQKIRDETPKNLEKDETASVKRVLLLTLTDGVQEVEGMEFKPIQALSLNLRPGVKIQVTGPVDVRRGRMMLEERHVKVIGGEVESLLVSNAAENVLAERLQLPLNPNPRTVQEAAFVQETTSVSMSELPTQITQPKPQLQPNIIPNNLNEQTLNREIDELLEVEREMEMNRPPKQHETTSDMFEDDLDFENIVIPTENPKSDSDLELNADLFNNIDLNNLINTNNKINDAPITIKRLLNDKINGKFKIKAKFKSIVEKLTLVNDEYYLVIQVEDDTGTLITRVHNDVIAGWARCTVTEFTRLKDAYRNDVPDALAKVMEVMKTLKDNLGNLDNTVEVEVATPEAYPNLIKVIS